MNDKFLPDFREYGLSSASCSFLWGLSRIKVFKKSIMKRHTPSFTHEMLMST